MKRCDHKGFEVLWKKIRRRGKIIRRVWRCAFCRKWISAPRESKSDRMLRAFKDGLSRRQVARKFKVSMEKLDREIRKRLL